MSDDPVRSLAPQPALWPGVLYNAIMVLCLPLVALGLFWRLVVQRKLGPGWREPFGVLPPELSRFQASGEPVVWVHAVSVGEVSAVEPIVRELRHLNPLVHIVLSTTTPTGREMAQRRNLQVDALVYFPYDFLTYAVHRALRTVRPDLVLLVDRKSTRLNSSH